MFSDIYAIEDILPEDNTYVLAHINHGLWHDKDDKFNLRYWKVVKFIRGISEKERKLLSNDDPRKLNYWNGDEGFNNEKPYCWEEFGPQHFFGQDVDFWTNLPRLTRTDSGQVERNSR